MSCTRTRKEPRCATANIGTLGQEQATEGSEEESRWRREGLEEEFQRKQSRGPRRGRSGLDKPGDRSKS